MVAIHVVIDGSTLRTDERSACAIFATQIAGNREGHLVEKFLRMVVVLDLNAVVGVDARAAKVAVAIPQRILDRKSVV